MGDGLAALRTLSHCPTDTPDDRALQSVLQARAYLALGAPSQAYQALATPAALPLAGVHALLRLRALVAMAGAPGQTSAAAQAALAMAGGLPASFQAEARYRWAAAQRLMLNDPGPTLHRATLQALAGDDAHPSVIPRALAELSRMDGTDAGWDRRLLVRWGHTAEGRRAVDRLSPTRLARTDRVARAEALFAARAYDLQQVEDRWLLTQGDDPGGVQAAHLRLGITGLRIQDDAQAAVGHLEAALEGPDAKVTAQAQYRLIYGYGRLARWAEGAAAAQTYLRTKPSHGRWKRARYQVGRLWHQAGQWAKAARSLEAMVAELERDQATWRWFIGWAWYRADACARADAVFAQLAPDENTLVGAKALYWRARCALVHGDRRRASIYLATLRSRAPVTYYGALGHALATAEGLTVLGMARPPRLSSDAPTLGWSVPAASEPDARAVRLLVRAGYPRLARPAADRLAPHLNEADQGALEQAVERFGLRWQRGSHQRVPWRENLLGQSAQTLRAAFPPAYLEVVRAAARAEGISPWWLLGHMLQESRFRERARSHAGALGPMQVLPRTGRRIAARLGFPQGDFFDDELYRPGVAVRHAAWYLAALRRDYGGNVLFAIAAYNGGPRRMGAHAAAHPTLDHPTLIEELGAHETRNYVRKVADHYLRFAAIYGSQAEYEAAISAVTRPQRAPVPLGEVRF